MRIVKPFSRKPLSREGLVLVVSRDLADPFAPGEVIADAEHRYTVVGVEAGERPREVNLLVKIVA